MKNYPIFRESSIAKFFYKGSHSHPVRRTIMIIDDKENHIIGYELREGKSQRDISNAPIKSYRKDKIAKIKQVDKRRIIRKKSKNIENTTLKKMSFLDLIKQGI